MQNLIDCVDPTKNIKEHNSNGLQILDYTCIILIIAGSELKKNKFII